MPSHLSAEEGNTRGRYSSWNIQERSDGTWQWSAHGPCGSTYSTAPTEAEAIAKAQIEAERLGKSTWCFGSRNA